MMIVGQNIAPIWKRAIARLVDCAVLVILTVVLILVWKTASLTKSTYLIRTLLPLVVGSLYFIGLHGRTGQTLGKMTMHIKVLQSDGSKVTYGIATVRSIVNVGISLLFAIAVAIALGRCDPEHWPSLAKRDQIVAVHSAFPSGFFVLKATTWLWCLAEVISLLVTRTRRAIHDFMAGTIVVEEKTPIGLRTPLRNIPN